MGNIIKNIKVNDDSYSFEKISCFERPVGIALSRYNEMYSSYYYMYIKLVESYNVLKYKDENYVDYKFTYLTTVLLEEYMGIKYNKYYTDNEISHFVENQIDKNNPVLIPCNLYGLYYSAHYMIHNWPHLFLINGYDEKRKLYNIIDSEQTNDKYSDFFMKYDQMEEIYRLHDCFHKKTDIFYLEQINSNDSKDEKEILINFMELYLNGLDKQPYKELEIIDVINSMTNNCNIESNYSLETLTRRLLNIPKYKEVIFSELIKCLELYKYNVNEIDLMSSIMNKLISSWTLFINKSLRKVYCHKPIEYNTNTLNDIYIYENELRKCIEKANKSLNNFSMCDTKLNEHDDLDYYCENNHDNIISIKNKVITFDFNNDKEYNSWLYDNCPKYIFNKKINLDSENYFAVTVNIDEISEETSYHCGIIIRTDNNQLYMWGIDSGISLKFDHIGVINIKEEALVDLNLVLYISINNDKCEFGYYDQKKNNQIIVDTVYLDSNVLEVGVACKTWGNKKRLLAQFSDYNLNVLDYN